MAVVRTLGKNTLGDNDKMKVAMRDYDMSTHDISTIFRSSIGVGMLVPFCKILCQKGDIIDINLINKTLSQPTLGPLFGSFKLQHFMFFGGFRLYNSWLHNNRTGIGMKMSDIKLPMMIAETKGAATDAKQTFRHQLYTNILDGAVQEEQVIMQREVCKKRCTPTPIS